MFEEGNTEPIEQANPNWRVEKARRLTAEEGPFGLKKLFVSVQDVHGDYLRGVTVRIETEESEGQIYDHPNWHGRTNERGYAQFDHLGVPTRYLLYMDSDGMPLLINIRTDLPPSYVRRVPQMPWLGNRPKFKVGWHSYKIEIVRRY